MAELDSTAQAALSSHFAPAWFCYADLADGALRATNFGADVTPSGTGDSDLDSQLFEAWLSAPVDFSDVSNSENGSDTLTVTLSGIASIDSSLLAQIGDTTKWQGRTFRLWVRIYDETGVTPQGAIGHLYTGYMSAVRLIGSPTEQKIQVSVENWLNAFNAASNRSYMNQKDYDSSDTSAAATLACANGMKNGVGAGSGGSLPMTGKPGIDELILDPPIGHGGIDSVWTGIS